MKKALKVILIALGLLFLIIVFLPSKKVRVEDSRIDTTSSETVKSGDLELVEWHWTKSEYGFRYLEGIVKNHSTRELSYTHIEFNLYNKDGVQVGSDFTNVTNLEPGGVWKFKIWITRDEAVEAKLKKLY